MDPSLIYLALVFFLAGITPELTGFGVAVISMSLLPFALPLSIVIPLVTIISITATGIVAIETKTRGLAKLLWPLLIGSVLGVILGMLFLKSVDEKILETTLAIFLIIYGIYGLFFHSHLFSMNAKTGAAVGVVAGLFGSSFNIHGPFVGLYSANGNLSKTRTKDLIATYVFITGFLTLAGHIYYERVTEQVLMYFLFAVPFLIIGLISGKIIYNKFKTAGVKHAINILVLLSGTALLF